MLISEIKAVEGFLSGMSYGFSFVSEAINRGTAYAQQLKEGLNGPQAKAFYTKAAQGFKIAGILAQVAFWSIVYVALAIKLTVELVVDQAQAQAEEVASATEEAHEVNPETTPEESAPEAEPEAEAEPEPETQRDTGMATIDPYSLKLMSARQIAAQYGIKNASRTPLKELQQKIAEAIAAQAEDA